MKLQEHIGKVSWSFADKFLYICYGFVSLLQMRYLPPQELGLFALLISLHTWIFVIGDSFALQLIIQFGTSDEEKPKANFSALIFLVLLILATSSLIFFFSPAVATLINEPQFPKISSYLFILVLLTIPRIFTMKLIYRDYQYNRLFLLNLSFFGIMTSLTLYYILYENGLNFEKMMTIYLSGTIFSSLTGILLKIKDLKFDYKIGASIKKYWSFSLPMTFYSAIHFLPRQLDVYFIQYFFSTAEVGIYYSAKTLFRVFDEAISASTGMVYPASVKLFSKNDKKSLHDLITKAVSFLFLSFLVCFAVLQLGLAEWFIKLFLPPIYYLAIPQFQLLLFAVLFLPFNILNNVIIAEGKPNTALLFVSISVIFSFLTLYIVGILGNALLIPFGLIIYVFILSLFCYFYSFKNYNFKPIYIFRAINDIINFLRNRKHNGTNN